MIADSRATTGSFLSIALRTSGETWKKLLFEEGAGLEDKARFNKLPGSVITRSASTGARTLYRNNY
jgi:hypothetical protein